MKRDRQDGPRAQRAASTGWLRYAGMGTEFAGGLIGLTLAGVWVDWHYGIRPVGTIVGAGLGIVGGMHNLIRQALALSKQQQADFRKDDDSDRGDPTRGTG